MSVVPSSPLLTSNKFQEDSFDEVKFDSYSTDISFYNYDNPKPYGNKNSGKSENENVDRNEDDDEEECYIPPQDPPPLPVFQRGPIRRVYKINEILNEPGRSHRQNR